MRIEKKFLSLFVPVFGCGVLSVVSSSAVASDAGMEAAEQVSLSSYTDSLDLYLYTHAGDDRGFGPEHDLAMNNIADFFEDYGLTVTLEPFTYWGDTYYNVVGTKLGTVYPDQEYIVGAHYDSVSNPGADDDASGTALLLEAARIIGQYDSAYTIRFVAFDREEQGLYGSYAYVDDHINDDILGMVQADMVAYDPDTNHARIYGRTSTSGPLKIALADAVAEYGNGLTIGDYGWNGQSDHAPFDAAGFQACLLIEGEVWNNPYYHTSQDTFEQIGNLNLPYAVKMVRSVVGLLVDLAEVDVPYDALDFSYPDGLLETVTPIGGQIITVEVTGAGVEVPQPDTGVFHYNTGAGWQAEPMGVLGDDLYQAVFPSSACGDEVLYYFSAEAVSGQVYTDPRNAPGTAYSAVSTYGYQLAFEENLTSNPGWTTQNLWDFGEPTGGGGQYGGPDPTSGHSDTYVYGYNLGGDYQNNLDEAHLTSTPIDCTGLFQTHLKFWRWLGVEQPLYDHAYVRVSNDGSVWTTIWENAAEITDSQWTEMDLDISSYADDQSTLYLRWTMGDTDVGWQYCGWNIDDIRLEALDCGVPMGDGDHDDDGDVDLLDFSWFQACFSGAETSFPPAMGCEDFTFDGDSDVDLDDYAYFQDTLFGGP